MREKIGQQIIMGLKGPTLGKDEADFIVANNIGGVVLFARNCQSPEQLRELTRSVQALSMRMADRAPLFVSIDMEGGRVLRLKDPFTKWPALAKVGAIGSTSVAYKFAFAMGEEMRAVGINMDFAPSLDIFSNPKNTVIGDRALSTTFEPVGRLGSALVRGYVKAGVIPCAKHFPGHGNTLLDSHFDLPIEERSLEEIDAFELEPFKKVFKAKLDLLMPTHIKYPKIDPDWPVSLSRIFLQDILRGKMRYRGMIVTDDLDMGALTGNYPKSEIAVRALEVGSNILLYCNQPDSPPTAIEAIEKAIESGRLSKETILENHRLVLDLKLARLATPAPESAMEKIGSADHKRLAEAIVSGKVPADLLQE